MFSCISPAKLNLFLYITGKRPDGYHNLQTLFVILDQGDVMHFETTSGDQVELLTDFGFNKEDNLIYKAAMQLKEYTHSKLGVSISIDKRLPQGGGLGGGSSNAATTLLVLNKLWHTQLSEPELLALGVKLGADVPIFIKGTTCFAEGIGDELEEVSYPDYYYVVCTPQNCKVPTKELFGAPDLKINCPKRSLDSLLRTPFDNVFTAVVCQKYPEVAALLQRLSSFGQACMSGSGSSCFVAFTDIKEAQRVYAKLKQDGIPCFLSRSVPHSPTLTALEQN